MKKTLCLWFFCMFAVSNMHAQYGSIGWAMDQLQKLKEGFEKQISECYYFKTSNNVTFQFHVGLKMLTYSDASRGAFFGFYEDGRISTGEISYHSRFGQFRMCRLKDGRFVINGPHTNGDVYVSSCTEEEYREAQRNCIYTDSRFSEDMYNIYQAELNAVNSGNSSGGDYSSSGNNYESPQSDKYVKTVRALKLTIIDASVTSTSYESLDIYQSSDGVYRVKVGSNAPWTFINNTNSTYLGVDVSGYQYWTMVTSAYHVDYYYYFNM